MVGLIGATGSPEAAAVATRWRNLNYLRQAIVLAAWLAALRTFALFYQQRGSTIDQPSSFTDNR